MPLSNQLAARNVERILIFIEDEELIWSAVFAASYHALDL